jgi:hypothetical protein
LLTLAVTKAAGRQDSGRLPVDPVVHLPVSFRYEICLQYLAQSEGARLREGSDRQACLGGGVIPGAHVGTGQDLRNMRAETYILIQEILSIPALSIWHETGPALLAGTQLPGRHEPCSYVLIDQLLADDLTNSRLKS